MVCRPGVSGLAFKALLPVIQPHPLAPAVTMCQALGVRLHVLCVPGGAVWSPCWGWGSPGCLFKLPCPHMPPSGHKGGALWGCPVLSALARGSEAIGSNGDLWEH